MPEVANEKQQDYIEINGDGKIEIIRKTIVKRGDLNEVYQTLMSSAPMQTPVLPVGTIAYSQSGFVKTFWILRQPSLVNIDVNKIPHRLAWPYAVYAIVMERLIPIRVSMFWAKGPITSDHDYLYHTGLTNADHSCRLCLGPTFSGSELARSGTYDGVIKAVINWIHTASFNDHLVESAVPYIPEDIRQIDEENLTVDDFRELYKKWEKWTIKAGDDWAKISTLSWSSSGEFRRLRGAHLS